MPIVSDPNPPRYAYGRERAHDAGRCPPRYEPLAEGVPAEAATRPWDDDERAEWAEMPMGGW